MPSASYYKTPTHVMQMLFFSAPSLKQYPEVQKNTLEKNKNRARLKRGKEELDFSDCQPSAKIIKIHKDSEPHRQDSPEVKKKPEKESLNIIMLDNKSEGRLRKQ